jgi:hypothetical protein
MALLLSIEYTSRLGSAEMKSCPDAVGDSVACSLGPPSTRVVLTVGGNMHKPAATATATRRAARCIE